MVDNKMKTWSYFRPIWSFS